MTTEPIDCGLFRRLAAAVAECAAQAALIGGAAHHGRRDGLEAINSPPFYI